MGQSADTLTLEQFRELFPWPENAATGRRLEWLWTFELDASPRQLWPHVCDTSRLNRSLELSNMEFEERDGKLYGTSKPGGLQHEWLEPPWEWIAGKSLSVVRIYDRGFAKWVRGVYLLEPHGEGTRMHVYFGWVPRNPLWGLVIKLAMTALKAKYRATLEGVAADVKSVMPEPYRALPPPLGHDVELRLEAIEEHLKGKRLKGAIVDALIALVREGDDLDIDRIRPRVLARQWNMDERDVLRACLYATRAGLFDLSWDVVCPLCRGARLELGELSMVPEDGRCEVCNYEFATVESHIVEITFRVHPSIREVPKLFYCSAEPASKEHIRLQVAVPAGSERTVKTELEAGQYRVRTLSGGDHRRLDVIAGDGLGQITVHCSGSQDHACGPSPEVTLVNDSDTEQLLVIECTGWADDALLPEQLLRQQEFYDLFSDAYIASDVKLSVGRQVVIFTDIVGSTRFYAEAGDPEAFMKVREHFDKVFEAVRTNKGAVVKTVGDAVMGAFSNAVDALRASRKIHEIFDGGDGDPIRLRISINAGSCIAVNLNSRIDFFGSSVNLAAKLQACCEGGEIAMSDVVYNAPGVKELIGDGRVEHFEYEVKALGEVVAVHRWHVN